MKFMILMDLKNELYEGNDKILFLESESKDYLIRKVERRVSMAEKIIVKEIRIDNTTWFMNNYLKNKHIISEAIVKNKIDKLEFERKKLYKEFCQDPIFGDFEFYTYEIFEIEEIKFKKVD